jgi:hypothetical protein
MESIKALCDPLEWLFFDVEKSRFMEFVFFLIVEKTPSRHFGLPFGYHPCEAIHDCQSTVELLDVVGGRKGNGVLYG